MNQRINPDNTVLTKARETSIYLNRELSQLAFNRRVLAQAEDASIPLLERLRCLCIVSSNLDEFFEVRIASMLAQHRIDGELVEPLALERTSTECHQIIERQYAILNNEILPQLSANGIHLLRHQDRNDECFWPCHRHRDPESPTRIAAHHPIAG